MRGYLLRRYNYDVFNLGRLFAMLASQAAFITSIGILVSEAEGDTAFFLIPLGISVFIVLASLISNIKRTNIWYGIIVTVLQFVFVLVILIVIAIIFFVFSKQIDRFFKRKK